MLLEISPKPSKLERMPKKYFYSILFVCFSATVVAQESKSSLRVQANSIEGLSFYPNPVSTGKIYITSNSSDDKEITIFDVLGKKVLQMILSGRELSIGNLSPGVYIIKFKEGESSETRKLIVK